MATTAAAPSAASALAAMAAAGSDPDSLASAITGAAFLDAQPGDARQQLRGACVCERRGMDGWRGGGWSTLSGRAPPAHENTALPSLHPTRTQPPGPACARSWQTKKPRPRPKRPDLPGSGRRS
jgi:hypothetical protein